MTRNLVEISVHTLKRIYHSENESLHKKEFTNTDESATTTSEKIISFLLALDLIETENDPDIYFLSPETYDLIESGELETYISHRLEEKQESNSEESQDKEKFVLFPPEEEVSRYRFKDYALYVLIVLALIIAYFVRKEIKERDETDLRQGTENQDYLEEIDEDGDTIYLYQ